MVDANDLFAFCEEDILYQTSLKKFFWCKVDAIVYFKIFHRQAE